MLHKKKQVCKRGTEWGMWGAKGGVMRAENSGKVGGEVEEEFSLPPCNLPALSR